MTKREYATAFVDGFCKASCINRERVEDWGKFIYQSSSLAVCLETLGLLTPEQEEYTKTRGGVLSVEPPVKGSTIPVVHTMREFLSKLPD